MSIPEQLADIGKRLYMVEQSIAELAGLLSMSIPPRHARRATIEGECARIFERHFDQVNTEEQSENGQNPATGR